MWSLPRSAGFVRVLMLCLGLCLGLTACGYRLGADAPTVLTGELRKAAIRSVSNPSLEPGLEYRMRSALRDELARRDLVDWTDRDEAAVLLDLTIARFATPGSLKDDDDHTLKRTLTMDVSARAVRRADGARIWRSGTVTVQESYFEGGYAEALSRAVDQAARRLADRLGHAY